MQAHQFFLLLSLLGCDSKDGASAAAKTTSPPPAATTACPVAYNQLPEAQRAGEVTCACAPAAVRGSVYGSGVYTTDSSICAAARHVGAIAANGGGDVTVKAASGCGVYQGTTANGITTNSWGSYASSFYFPSKGDGKCAAPVAVAADPCPTSWDRVPNATATARLSCSCPSTPPTGAVYGTGIYTSDSSICRAALHAGVITASGGTVTVIRAAGCPSFKGSEANGVSSTGWGTYPVSFYFDGHGTGGC